MWTNLANIYKTSMKEFDLICILARRMENKSHLFFEGMKDTLWKLQHWLIPNLHLN